MITPPETHSYTTPNFQLILPSFTDRVDIRVINAAFEKLDASALRAGAVGTLTFTNGQTLTPQSGFLQSSNSLAVQGWVSTSGGVYWDGANFSVHSYWDGTYWNLQMPGPTANMGFRVQNTGNIYVGHPGSSVMFEGGLGWLYFDSNYGSTGQPQPFALSHAITAPAFTPGSSRRFKHNVLPLNGAAMDIVLDDRVHGVAYDDVRFDPPHAQVGFVADDWLDVLPEVVSVDREGQAAALDYDRIGAVTFEALKHLSLQVMDLSRRLAVIEGGVA